MIVSVLMITYNHENYICQAIDGVLMQETNFDFELIVANDTSPDNSDTVIKDIIANHPKGKLIKYLNREKNLGIEENFLEASSHASGKYMAICEGDDYWTDPLKLQKQVDFLDANPDYVMCTHNYSVYNQEKKVLNDKKKFETNLEYNLNVYFDHQYTPTLTSCWRNIFEDYSLLKKGKWFSDFYLFFEVLKHGKGYFMVDNMATYRIHDSGICSSLTEGQKMLNHILMMEDLLGFNPSLSIINKHLARYNLIYFNYLIRVKKENPNWKYLIQYYKSETELKRLLKTTFVGLPFYFARYWIPNFIKKE